MMEMTYGPSRVVTSYQVDVESNHIAGSHSVDIIDVVFILISTA